MLDLKCKRLENWNSPSTASTVRSKGVSSRNPDTNLNHLGNPNRPCRSQRDAACSRRPGGDEPSTCGRKRQTRGKLPLVLHWRHCCLRRPVHNSHKWVADVLMSTQVVQATPHIIGACTQCTGTQNSLVVKLTNSYTFKLKRDSGHLWCG